MEPIHTVDRENLPMKVLSAQEISGRQVVHEAPGIQRSEMSTESRDPRSELP